jgi:hypothetical protein
MLVQRKKKEAAATHRNLKHNIKIDACQEKNEEKKPNL